MATSNATYLGYYCSFYAYEQVQTFEAAIWKQSAIPREPLLSEAEFAIVSGRIYCCSSLHASVAVSDLELVPYRYDEAEKVICSRNGLALVAATEMACTNGADHSNGAVPVIEIEKTSRLGT